jgi:hypothetical protein
MDAAQPEPHDYPVVEWEDLDPEKVILRQTQRKDGKIRWLYEIPGRGSGWTNWVEMKKDDSK